MLAKNNLDKKIITLLPVLSPQQMKAVLTVVKTFAESYAEAWNDDKYQQDMDKRCSDYENGKVETFTIQQTIASAKATGGN